MKLTAQAKLMPTEAQAESLKRTMEAANSAANFSSRLAWNHRVFGRVPLQKLVYHPVRQEFGISAQSACLMVRKVADAYKLDKKTIRAFRPLGAVAFDDRILAWKLDKQTVSIWTMDGRLTIPFSAGDYQTKLLQGQRGETDLVYRDGEFYLLSTCAVEEQPLTSQDDFLGVDLGVVNIAVDSDGEIHSAKAVNNVRFRHRRLRKKLQAKGTKASRRRLKKLSGKERRFAKHVNHAISKHIVTKAKDTDRGIALEELGGIRDRVTARKPQRVQLHSWSFFQLRSFIEYKAKQMGVEVKAVDPRNTSRTCPCCGHVDKANRKTQSKFLCVDCAFSGLADHIAATNIRCRASVTTPNISTTDVDFYL
ncbi:MAG: transposase [Caldilineaceae bacterium]|nr:transposase [Caldilineaceae bacterium]